MNEIDYENVFARLRRLQPGECLIYFTGYLDSERLSRPRGIAAGVADFALLLSTNKKAFLVQRRCSPPLTRGMIDWRSGHGTGFDYIAIGAREEPIDDAG